MGDDPEPKAVAKKVYKCGEDDATLPNRFDKIDGSQAHSQVPKHVFSSEIAHGGRLLSAHSFLSKFL